MDIVPVSFVEETVLFTLICVVTLVKIQLAVNIVCFWIPSSVPLIHMSFLLPYYLYYWNFINECSNFIFVSIDCFGYSESLASANELQHQLAISTPTKAVGILIGIVLNQ